MGERQRENEERRQGLRLGMSKIYNIFRFKLNPCGVLGGISFSMSRSVRSSALHSLGQSHKTFPFFFFSRFLYRLSFSTLRFGRIH